MLRVWGVRFRVWGVGVGVRGNTVRPRGVATYFGRPDRYSYQLKRIDLGISQLKLESDQEEKKIVSKKIRKGPDAGLGLSGFLFFPGLRVQGSEFTVQGPGSGVFTPGMPT